MAYCTEVQVPDEFNGVTFSTTTNPTLATVTRWIAEADSIINAKVGLRYVATNINETDHPNDIIVIRQICIYLVSARVRRRLNKVGPNSQPSKIVVTETDSKAMKMLDQIAEGKMLMSELSPVNTSLGLSSYNSDNAEEYTFKKNTEQW